MTYSFRTSMPRSSLLLLATLAACSAGASPARTPAATGHAAAGASPHWTYAGEAGPEHWGGLDPSFQACAAGQVQSPVALVSNAPHAAGEPLRFDYQLQGLAPADNGHTVVVPGYAGSSVLLGSARYTFKQLHFHTPSEHTLDGRHSPAEVHLVHADTAGHLLVVGVLFDEGASDPALAEVLSVLDQGAARTAATFDPAEFLPVDRATFRYAGSLTTPPCSEGVRWSVMRRPRTMSPTQLQKLVAMTHQNSRPTQPLAGRVPTLVLGQ